SWSKSRIGAIAVRALQLIGPWLPRVRILAEWPQALLTFIAGAAVISCLVMLRQVPATELPPAVMKMMAGGLVIFAFPLLVGEPAFANVSSDRLPEAPALNRLMRLPLATSLLLAVSLVLASAGYVWTRLVENAVALVLALVALELAARALVTVFVPAPPI